MIILTFGIYKYKQVAHHDFFIYFLREHITNFLQKPGQLDSSDLGRSSSWKHHRVLSKII